MTGITWTETFSGWLASDAAGNFSVALLATERHKASASIQVSFADVDSWIRDPTYPGEVTPGGSLKCDDLDCTAKVNGGVFQVFVPANERLPDAVHLRMRYRLDLTHDPSGEALTLYGFKLVENDPGFDSWSDVTTMFTRVYRGAHPAEPDPRFLFAIGVLRISLPAFLREMLSFSATTSVYPQRVRTVLRYQSWFLRRLARAYVGSPITQTRPSFPVNTPEPGWRVSAHDQDWHPVPEKTHIERKIFPFPVRDLDFPLNVQRLRPAGREPTGDPVLLIPGSGVRANMFYGQPVGPSLAEYLLDCGYDVWVENWRASIDFPRNSYTLDQAARLDHVQAVDLVLRHTDRRDGLRAVVHCQGSVSFLMAYTAGYLDGKISHVVSSAVSLFVEVRMATWLKQRLAVPIVQLTTPSADAQWGLRSDTPTGAVFGAISRLMERPCGNPACQAANFMYGSGWDTLLLHVDQHGNDWVDPAVHQWSARELGATPLTFFDQICDASRYGHVVPAEAPDVLTPADYIPTYRPLRPRADNPRFTFIAGDENRMFRWQGQRDAARYMREFQDCAANFVGLPGFGHLDTMWGIAAPVVVFPVICDGLRWDGVGKAPSERAADRGVSQTLREAWPTRDGRVPRVARAIARFARGAPAMRDRDAR